MASIINVTAAQLHFSPTLEMNEAVDSARKAGKKVVQLSFGEGTFPVQADMLAMHKRESGVTNYLPVAGLAELRKARARQRSRYSRC
jgi:aspartate/methionine/tyrosine aminotransferase